MFDCPSPVRGLALFAALSVSLAQAQESPAAFALKMPIKAEAAAPFHRLTLPLSAYLASAGGALADLRVFDGDGRPVPFALLAASGSTEQSWRRQALRWFPLRAAADGPAADDLRVVVRKSADGTLVDITGKTARADPSSPKAVRGYLLDASAVEGREAARSLDLDWRDDKAEFQLLDVSASDDLQHWHSLAEGIQLARLNFGGAAIERRRVDLAGFRDRYLRLTWREPATAPVLTRAELELADVRMLAPPRLWSAPLTPLRAEAGALSRDFRYRLAQPLPLTRLRLELAPGNQVMPLQVLAPVRDRRDRPGEVVLAEGVAYRLTNRGREWLDAELPLSGASVKEFALRVDPRFVPAGGPSVSVAIEPAQVLFLAGGHGPYTLAVGNPQAKSAALAPATLVPGFGTAQSAEIGIASVLENTAAPSLPNPAVPSSAEEGGSWRKTALWAVLIAGVLAMAAMAWQLLQQMKRD